MLITPVNARNLELEAEQAEQRRKYAQSIANIYPCIYSSANFGFILTNPYAQSALSQFQTQQAQQNHLAQYQGLGLNNLLGNILPSQKAE